MPTHLSQIITFQWGSKYRYIAKTSTKETSLEDTKMEYIYIYKSGVLQLEQLNQKPLHNTELVLR